MATLPITTLSGAAAQLDDEAIDAFRAGLRGALLRPADPGYDEARRVNNALIDRRPGRCSGR